MALSVYEVVRVGVYMKKINYATDRRRERIRKR